ncbi:MAG: hypothetical protein SXV54_18720, partial [Chloroflexota bacterium]|nr:hypothetical protein [Chloroflexota bacterium]
ETIISYIRQSWDLGEVDEIGDWWRQRKSFMGLIAEVAWEQVQSGDVDWVALSRSLLGLLEEKHLLIYLEHPDAASLLAEQGWDGALRSGLADFLMVLDSNVGYNKVNPRVQEAITYHVDLWQSSPQATLTLVYTHTGTTDVPCVQESRYGSTYEDMMDRCYWYYLQVYVPQDSRLLDATRIPVPGEALSFSGGESGKVSVRTADEGPWLSLGVMGLLPSAVTQTRLFTWTLPADVVEWQADEGWYSLRVQKQPGTSGHPLTVRVRLPEESVLLDATPEPTAVEGEWVVYRTTLSRDREFRLHFGRQP